jgi:PIN domain nuclease of toxin-antitoxin system
VAEGVPVILDTCALLWLAEGSPRISRLTRRKMQESNVLYVPAVSGLEIARKVYQGRLHLPLPPADWFGQMIQEHGLTELPVDLKICLHAAGLPHIHDDPVDRLIIAAAKIYQCEVVTSDERFAEYGIPTLI